ncbi:MAG: MAPEG family protein [Pseudomonadota bacterium]|jgi:hypothetical protein|uniref:MAPEG family protein n=1 Tax=Alteromonas sp. MTD1 TaxID=3057962 RepID=UPI002EAE3BF4|nr:MAPEG family protein [Pseudomonadota bacterium]MEC8416442.1 MAPEG family protein [Pseudomonadota bacterium]
MASILTPVVAHIFWCALLYALLTVARAPAVWGVGRKVDGSNPFQNIQTKISANLTNQFEWPVFFHVLCVMLYLEQSAVTSTMMLMAWAFVIGRVLHSLVQICSSNVRIRGLVFTINFLAVIAMWILFLFKL